MAADADRRPRRRAAHPQGRRGAAGAYGEGAGRRRRKQWRSDIRGRRRDGHRATERRGDRRVHGPGGDRVRVRGQLRRHVGAGDREAVRGERPASRGRAHVPRDQPDGGPARAQVAARPRRADLFPARQGRAGSHPDGRLRVQGQALGRGRHSRGPQLQPAEARLGPLQGLLGSRYAPCPGDGESRHRPILRQRGVFHARQPLHHGRGPGAQAVLRRRGAELDRHRRRRRGRQGHRGVDRSRPPDDGPDRGGHSALPPLPEPLAIPVRPHRRDRRHAVRDALAPPAARDRS